VLNSTNYRYIFWLPSGAHVQGQDCFEGWYFWDECGLIGGGPFATELLALDALRDYNRRISASNEEENI